jgi:hypothetical protein
MLAGAPTSMEGRYVSQYLDACDLRMIWVCRRTRVLADAAKTLEHGIHNMCATPSGYGERLVQKRGAIMSLVVGEGTSRAEANAKKGALDEDEDVGEVMEALRGGVAKWWHTMQTRSAAIA